jgi:hypothetical protein
MKRAYRNALSMIVQGSIICQSIDKQRELDRYLVRQQKPTANDGKAQTVSDGSTTATALNADIGFHIEMEANHV